MFEIVYIELTSRCNLYCMHCGMDRTCINELDINVLKNRLLYLKKKGLKQICLSGGEPLSHPKFYELVLYIQEIELEWSIITNGILFDYKFINFINNNPFFKKLCISLEGPDKFLNDYIRGKGTFDKVDNNLNLLNDNILNKTVLQMCLNKINYEYIDEFINYCTEKKVNYHFVIFSGTNKAKGYEELNLSEGEKITIERKLKTLNIKTIGDLYSCCLTHSKNRNFLYITDKGNIALCAYCAATDIYIGNIYDDKFIDIKKYYRLINDIRKFKKIRIDRCNSCIAKRKCKNGCYVKYYIEKKIDKSICTKRVINLLEGLDNND